MTFSLWWLLVPVGVVSLALFQLSGWGEVFALPLALLVVLHPGSLASIASRWWGPRHGAIRTPD